MTTMAGSVVHQARFLPFGEQRPWSGAPSSAPWLDRGFTGHLHNDEVGLIYMNARYYVPGIGRFASADTIVPDPTNPQQFNRYSYALNNPLRFNDPSGHSCSAPIDVHEHNACTQVEQDILASTVIIKQIFTRTIKIPGVPTVIKRITAYSHGTIKNDQTIVTHNHFITKSSDWTQAIELYDAQGSLIPYTGSINKTPLLAEDNGPSETSEWTFSSGTFSAQKFASFINQQTNLPQSNDEIAVVQWRGSIGTTFVQWSEVQATGFIPNPDQKDRLINSVIVSPPSSGGGSGGGYFWQGQHFANHLDRSFYNGNLVAVGAINP